MQENDARWIESINKFKGDLQISDDPDAMISMHEYIDTIKKEEKVALQNFLNPK